jgi:hypothetical protein
LFFFNFLSLIIGEIFVLAECKLCIAVRQVHFTAFDSG